MDKKELAEAYQKFNEQVKEETGKDAVAVLASAGFTITALVKAWRRAKRGDYTAALYYLLMWYSMKSSSERAMLLHHVRKNGSGPVRNKRIDHNNLDWDVLLRDTRS